MSALYNKNVILIVGGLSSGRQLAPLFKGLGFACVHVCTRFAMEHPLFKPTFVADDYVENHVLASENEAPLLVERLRGRNVRAVIAGTEICVMLADTLARLFDVPRNVDALSWARRSKFQMHETLRAAGLKSARQVLSASPADLVAFQDKIGGRVVVKPEASANTDGVTYCADAAEVEAAARRILGSQNFLGLLNSQVLAQEYLAGKQYLVNSVSSAGLHHICDVWGELRENDAAPSNDSYADFVRPDAPIQGVLSAYATQVLDALGIQYGAAHMELRMTEEGPCLVEVAARMSGNIDHSVLYGLNSLTQVSLLADGLLDPTSFYARTQAAPPTTRVARKVYLASLLSGPVVSAPDLALFLDLETVVSLSFWPRVGDVLQKTDRAKGHGRPGYLYMVADDPAHIDRDYPHVRQNERLIYERCLQPPNTGRQAEIPR